MAVDDKRERAKAVMLAAGYGVVCGLVFPLMVQSVFLHEIGLAHGAGESFGLLFFVAYSVTMLLCAAFYGLAGGTHAKLGEPGTAGKRAMSSAIPGSRRDASTRPLLVGLACAFAGNALMLAHSLGAIEDGWPYSIAAAGSIGCGLALAELGWAVLCSRTCEGRPMRLAQVVSGSYLAGSLVSSAVFALSGAIELSFALLVIAGSAALFRFAPLASAAASPAPASLGLHATAERGVSPDLVRSTAYLAVFSFVFGAVGQAGAAAGGGVPVQLLALIGMGVAAAVSLVASMAARKVLPVADLDASIFPVAAIALVMLPLVANPAVRDLALFLLFSAFFLSGLNARVTVCQLGWASPGQAGALVCASLGAGGLAMLAGVAAGSVVLDGSSLQTGISTVSLVSLFALAMTTFIYRELHDRRAAQIAQATQVTPETPRATPDSKAPHAILADRLGLTSREAEILELVCQGRSRSYIADELGLSPNTVKSYAHSLYQKAGVDNKQALIDLVRAEEATGA